MTLQINIDRRAIAEFCRRHHIRRLALFGSALRKDFARTAMSTSWWSSSASTCRA
jgi:predicted nucleotidyltransferase